MYHDLKSVYWWPTMKMDIARFVEKSSLSELAELYAKEIVSRHGVPLSIVSDRDSRFLSNFWNSLQQNLGTHVNFSTAYYPQTDGQSPEIVQMTAEKVAIAREKLKATRDRQKIYADPRRRLCKVEDETQLLPLKDLKVDLSKKLVEEPIRIVDHKITKLRKKQIPMVLIEWKHSLGSNLTWETEELLKTRYPHLFNQDQISRMKSL
ncbi:uncharacterized protein [Rutidosis leptorrhynchoides]|uniref:uncharacterized protein n=1 Tax=Rutidosis leptorrhynchoides TaxID=125765 RepID=UPI003A99CAD2